MNELLLNILMATITAAIPLLAGYLIRFLREAADNAATSAAFTGKETVMQEVLTAVADAVAATSQTYVDSLKKTGTFTVAAQQEARERALDACYASLTPAAMELLDNLYPDVRSFLRTKIEAEVRAQKLPK